MKKLFTTFNYAYILALLSIFLVPLSLISSQNKSDGMPKNAFEVKLLLSPPVLITPDGGQSFCQGTIQPISWSSSGITNIAIFLSSDGGNTFSEELISSIPASLGNWLWNIPPIQPTGNMYRIKIADASDNSVNDVSSSNFTIKEATKILTEPQPLNLCEGSKAEFEVTAAGENLSYKWRKNGVDIPFTNAPKFTIDKIKPSDAGLYDVVVTGNCTPQATSATAELSIIIMPRITQDIKNQTGVAGSTVTFEVTASGDNLTYDWRKNKKTMGVETSNVLVLENIVLADSGYYECQILNECNTIYSFNAFLKVLPDRGPVLTVLNNNVKFDTVLVGFNKTINAKNILKNTGKKELEVTEIKLGGPDASEFTIVGNPTYIWLQPDSSFTFKLTFNPASVGSKSATISFKSNSDSTSPVINLNGFGGVVSVSCDKECDFGNIMASPTNKKYTILNNGNLSVTLNNLNVINNPKSAFKVAKPSLPYKINPNGSLELTVTFESTTWDSYTANLELIFAEITSPIQVDLKAKYLESAVFEPGDIANNLFAYPNPMKDNITFELNDNNITGINFEVTDIIGNKIYSSNNIRSIEQGYIIEWNGKDINNKICPNGLYFAIFRFKDTNKIIPVVINR